MAQRRKVRPRLNYQEGSWFQVPLAPGGPVAVGLAARIDGGGGLLGYFFLLDTVPTVANLARLKRSDAQGIIRCGDLHLLQERWRVLSLEPVTGWDRLQWPIPAFRSYDDLRERWELRTYDDRLHLQAITPATAAEVKDLPEDGLSGAEAVELELQQLAGSTRPVKVRRLAA